MGVKPWIFCLWGMIDDLIDDMILYVLDII